MNIVKCLKCEKYIHKASKCPYCGNSLDFEDMEMPPVHENAAADYAKVEDLIENKKYEQALELSDAVVEWMPSFSGIFWLRLLAGSECSCAADLIQKGFDCERNPDFCNALAFSAGIEHSVYVDVKKLVSAARKALRIEVLNHEYQCKMEIDLCSVKKIVESKISAEKKKLFSLWLDLDQTEQRMYALEKDCLLLAKEYSNTLTSASKQASSIKTETECLAECSAEQFHEYQVKIASVLQQSEEARQTLSNLKQHSWVKEFYELVKKRDQQVQTLSEEISSLKNYEDIVQQTLNQVEQIEEQHRLVVHAVDQYDFRKAASLLGQQRYHKVFCSIGLLGSMSE